MIASHSHTLNSMLYNIQGPSIFFSLFSNYSKKTTPSVRPEPPTFRFTAIRGSQLSHGELPVSVINNLKYNIDTGVLIKLLRNDGQI